MSIRRIPLIAVLAILAAGAAPSRAYAVPAGPNEPEDVAPAPAAPAASAPTPPAAAATADRPAAGECLRFADESGQIADGLRATTLAIGSVTQSLSETHFVGLSTLSEERVWQLVGGRPDGKPTIEQSAVLVARLAQSGLFARITPAVRLSAAADGGAVFEVTLIENPTLRGLEITGLSELTRAEILDALLLVPDEDASDDDGDDHKRAGHDRDRSSDVFHMRRHPATDHLPRLALRCPAPIPPRAWVAHHAHGTLRPGIVWHGVDAALERVQELLHDQGYLLGRVTATLGVDGKLTLVVDEGHLDGVVVEGVDAALRDDVLGLLGIAPGGSFNVEDLRVGVQRVESRYPFLAPDKARRPAPPAYVLVRDVAAEGAVHFRFDAGPARCDDDDDIENWTDFVEAVDHNDFDFDRLRRDDDDERDCSTVRSWYHLDGRRLIVYFRSERVDLDADGIELLRHTQVTGFAPGLGLVLHVWDPADRVHFRFDTLFNLNTSRDSITATDDGALAELSAAQRVDLLVAPSLSIPGIGLAELGVAAYTLTDTDDSWRTTDLDSYLNSGLWDRPEREYYRRTGVSAFATFHWFDALTVGGEWRRDRYDSMTSLADDKSLFGDDPASANPAISDGTFGSLILRAEWASQPTRLRDVIGGGRRRGAQGTIVDQDAIGRPESGLRTVATFELADPSLGGHSSFWRVASDSVLSLATGDDQAVFVRVRVGGGHDLPLQRQEALGGWGSLRGYDFKEMRGGDWSLLSSLEYRFDALSAFVDLGAVRGQEDRAWSGPRLGLGTALNLGDSAQLAFAWRADAEAKGSPEIRLLFGRPW